MNSTDKSSIVQPGDAGKVILGRIWWVGLLGAAASVAANLILRAVFFMVLPLPDAFPPLQPAAIAAFTLIGTILAAVVFAVVVRFSRTPLRTFRIVAGVALVLSILPNFGLMVNPSAAPFPGGSALAFGILIVFHGVAALVCVEILTRMTRKKSSTGS